MREGPLNAPLPAAVSHTLNAAERGFLVRAHEDFAGRMACGLDDDALLREFTLAAHRLPEGLATRLLEFRQHTNVFGTLLLRGVPTGEVAPTPATGDGAAGRAPGQAAVSLTLIMSLLGEVISYADEKSGALIQDIVPVRGQEERQENSGSVFLEFHTEDGFHPHKPDFVGLFCLRQDHGGEAVTATSSIMRAVPGLPRPVVEVLRRPLYRIRLASSFASSRDAVRHGPPQPVLRGGAMAPELCVDFHGTDPLTPEAGEALSVLREAMTRAAVGARLGAGDLVIVDNRTTAHARTAFTPRYDGADRWLQRMFVVADLRASAAVRLPGSRVCLPLSECLPSAAPA